MRLILWRSDMSESTQAHLERYLRERSLENFLALRDAVIASPGYAPYTGRYEGRAGSLLEDENYQEAIDYLVSMMDNWLLNPGIHRLAAYAYHKLGRDEDAGFEYWLFRATLEGITSTGDGSFESPYLVLHTKDEYDVLEYLGKETRRQRLVKGNDRQYDCHDCTDGSEIWFDITTPFGFLGRRIEKGDLDGLQFEDVMGES